MDALRPRLRQRQRVTALEDERIDSPPDPDLHISTASPVAARLVASISIGTSDNIQYCSKSGVKSEVVLDHGWKNLGFLEKVFRCLGFFRFLRFFKGF